MNLDFGNSKIKRITAEDDVFFIKDGFSITTRAGVEITAHCPDRYKAVIVEALNNGWLRTAAYMREEEYTWEVLKK